MSYVALVGIGLVGATVVFMLLLVARRWRVVREERRRDELVTRLRPAAVELLEADTPQAPPQLHGPEAHVFAQLLAGYARVLRGEPQDRIAAYFEGVGGVDAEIRHLRSRRTWRRATAAFTLGDMASRRAVPALLESLADRAREVRVASVRSLGRLGAVEAIEPIVAAGVARSVPRDVASLALLDVGPPALPQLVELATHPLPAIRADAIELVGLLGAAGDAEQVQSHLEDPAAGVRVATADALGRLGAAEARDALMRALDDRVPAVRAAAAHALGQIGGRTATEALLPVARTDAFAPARAAAEALAHIDPGLVIRAAEAPDAGPHLREAADLVRL